MTGRAYAEQPFEAPEPWRGFLWLSLRECHRVLRLWTQTTLAPIVSSLLFIIVFGLSLGGRISEIHGYPYEIFIVPGLIAMAMAQAVYSNNASTIFQARNDRYIDDVLAAPMYAWQMNLGFNVGGYFRALMIGGALTPIVTIFGLDFGLLLGGAVLTESTFSLNGVGKYAVNAIMKNDLPQIMGVTMLTAFFVVIANLIVDLLYAVVDPRVRLT